MPAPLLPAASSLPALKSHCCRLALHTLSSGSSPSSSSPSHPLLPKVTHPPTTIMAKTVQPACLVLFASLSACREASGPAGEGVGGWQVAGPCTWLCRPGWRQLQWVLLDSLKFAWQSCGYPSTHPPRRRPQAAGVAATDAQAKAPKSGSQVRICLFDEGHTATAVHTSSPTHQTACRWRWCPFSQRRRQRQAAGNGIAAAQAAANAFPAAAAAVCQVEIPASQVEGTLQHIHAAAAWCLPGIQGGDVEM